MKDKTHTEITKEQYPNARIGYSSKMHVYQNRSQGESHKSYKKRVAFISGNRKKVFGRGSFPAFPFASGEQHKKAYERKNGKTAHGRALNNKSN